MRSENRKPASQEDFTDKIKREFAPQQLTTSLFVGLTNGVFVIVLGVSLAALIFSSHIPDYLGRGIGFMLFGTLVVGLTVALTSSQPGMLAFGQDVPAAALAAVTASIVGQMSGKASTEEIFYTAMALIVISTLFTGVFFIFMGKYKLGNIVRFLPYPVLGGFITGIGLILVKGGIGITTDIPVTISAIPKLIQPAMLLKWASGCIFGLALYFILHRSPHFLTFPGLIILFFALFYVILLATQTTVETAIEKRFLLGDLTQGESLWSPLSASMLQYIHWPVVLSHMGTVGVVAMLSIIELLLALSALELIIGKDFDTNWELKTNGIANLISGLGGGFAGFTSVTQSTVNIQLGAKGRLTGIFAAACVGGVLLFGAEVLKYFPKFILGGLLIYPATSIFREWFVEAPKRMPLSDMAIVVIIFLTIGFWGFLEGIVIGLILTTCIFVVKYSRAEMVKNELSGSVFHSSVERLPVERKLLERKGNQVYILKLQGYIFFGTAFNLLKIIDAYRKTNGIKFLVLDFRMVTGLDSSAMNSLNKLTQIAEKAGFVIVMTDLPGSIKKIFKIFRFGENSQNIVRIFSDIDHGVEWCENRILAAEHEKAIQNDKSLLDIQTETFYDAVTPELVKRVELEEKFGKLVSDLEEYLERFEIGENECLMKQGEESDEIYFLVSGKICAEIESDTGETVRLRTMTPGNIVGEIGVYLKQKISATIVTREPCIIYVLSVKNIARMEKEKPGLAMAFHKYVAYQLSERVVNTNKLVNNLLK